jgi:hypothetical protein
MPSSIFRLVGLEYAPDVIGERAQTSMWKWRSASRSMRVAQMDARCYEVVESGESGIEKIILPARALPWA